MTEYFFEGDLTEFPKKLPTPLKTPDLNDFITGFLLGEGEIVSNTCRYITPFENFALWIKNCFERFELSGFIEYFPGKKSLNWHKEDTPEMWRFSTSIYSCLELFQKHWYHYRNRKIIRIIKITPFVLFLLYLQYGYYYEFKGVKYVKIKDRTMTTTLRKIGVTDITCRKDYIQIKEPSQQKFFTYLLSHDYSIPECYKRNFPSELLEGRSIFTS